jgi:hypothetical protein
VPVITPEDLIATKILAGRPKDIEDIRGVIHQRRASLDIERIRTLLHFLESALSQSDLSPVFEKEWVEAEQDLPVVKKGDRKTRPRKTSKKK